MVIHLHDRGSGNGCLDAVSEAKATKEKADQLDFIKLQLLCFKRRYQENEDTLRMRGSMCQSYKR